MSPVEDFAVFAGFSCGNNDLDGFIRDDAERHETALMTKTYAITYLVDPATGDNETIGFVSLLNDSLRIDDGSNPKATPSGFNYKNSPAVKIGRLGIDCTYHRSGIGSSVMNLIKSMFLSCNRTGCRFITVDAYKNRKTLAFYQKNGFDFLTTSDKSRRTRLLFFDLSRHATDDCPGPAEA